MEHCKNYRIVNGTDGNEVKKNDILTSIYFDDTKQGRIALEEHFKNSRFACDTDDYLPLIFRPPRNGKNSSIPATVAAVHQSSRVLTNNNNNNSNNSSQEDHSRVPRNGERASLGNGNSQDSTAQDLDMGVAGGQPRASSSSSSGGHRTSNMPQQQHRWSIFLLGGQVKVGGLPEDDDWRRRREEKRRAEKRSGSWTTLLWRLSGFWKDLSKGCMPPDIASPENPHHRLVSAYLTFKLNSHLCVSGLYSSLCTEAISLFHPSPTLHYFHWILSEYCLLLSFWGFLRREW